MRGASLRKSTLVDGLATPPERVLPNLAQTLVILRERHTELYDT
jgi:hypothetical protein